MSCFLVLVTAYFCTAHAGSYDSEKIRLADIQALTLYADRMTTGRRLPPVPQLKCLKGCHFPQPKVVQCMNRGWDGYSVQWECKAELDSRSKLGQLEVVCEGYDYSNDPHILKGSCGLEYSIESRPGYSEGSSGPSYGWKQNVNEEQSSFGSVLFILCCCIVLYGIYKTCLAPSLNDPDSQYSTTDDDRPDDGLGPNARRNMGWNIPGSGPGFGSQGTEHMPHFDGCGTRRRRRSFWHNMGGGGGGGGFWTGLATGGMMGYMFGGNNRRGNNAAPRSRGFYGGDSGGLFSAAGPSASSSGSTTESTSFGGSRTR